MNFPDDRRYMKSHEWAMLEDGKVRVGITRYATDELGDIVFLDLPEVGTETTAGEPMGEIESAKAVADINAPVTGKVAEINEPLLDSLETMSEDPHGEGWMVVIEPTDPSELDALLNADEYARLCEEAG